MTDSADSATLDRPGSKLQTLSFCAAEPDALGRWLEALPRSNLGASATQLYSALKEINQCALKAKQHFALLEVIRPVTHNICESLAQHLRSQPVVLPPQAHTIFQLTQHIQLQQAQGYETVANLTELGKQPARMLRKKQDELTAKAIHRAINERIRTLIRCQLIYADCSAGLWRPIHKLYIDAKRRDLHRRQFNDRVAGQTCLLSIEQCYLKCLLLGSVHSNQLRQEDMLQIFEYMPEWVTLVELAAYENANEDQLVIDLHSDDPPIFQSCIKPPPERIEQWQLLVVEKLLYHLGELLDEKVDNTLSDDLIKHLLISWGNDTDRTFLRMDSQDTLSICIGLSNLHFFSAGEVEYQEFIEGSMAQPLQVPGGGTPLQRDHLAQKKAGERDLWDRSFDPQLADTRLNVDAIDDHIRHFARQRAEQHTSASSSAHRSYTIRTVNVSPGGYGLSWPEGVLARVNNGDILGIRDSHQSHWAAGVVSWLRRSEGEATQLGVKLLGSSVQPFGARLANDSSENGNPVETFQRVLLLPAIKPINQAASLIAPARMFRCNQNLTLVQQGRQMLVNLKTLLSSKGPIDHFEVELLNKPWGVQEDDFNDLGDSLTADWPAL